MLASSAQIVRHARADLSPGPAALTTPSTCTSVQRHYSTIAACGLLNILVAPDDQLSLSAEQAQQLLWA